MHYTTKPPDATNWTLPLQRPCVHANAVLSLPSDKKSIRFMSASFGSPVLSTLNRALRKAYLSSLPRFASALLCKHPPNSVATAMGHLDRRRQGLDSTTPVPVVPPLLLLLAQRPMKTIFQNFPVQLSTTTLPSTPSSSILQTLMRQVVIQSHQPDLDMYITLSVAIMVTYMSKQCSHVPLQRISSPM